MLSSGMSRPLKPFLSALLGNMGSCLLIIILKYILCRVCVTITLICNVHSTTIPANPRTTKKKDLPNGRSQLRPDVFSLIGGKLPENEDFFPTLRKISSSYY